jgi:hypothetical protein
MELSAGCVPGRSRESIEMKILGLQCYLTTVVWLPTYFQTLYPAVERLWLSDPHLPYLRYSAGSGSNVPRRSARSFINTKNTGTRIST